MLQFKELLKDYTENEREVIKRKAKKQNRTMSNYILNLVKKDIEENN
ncbi:hypothetical protein KQI68_07255 [Peptoniphilus sp. MSJ-1]|uniref:Uncharacterized protein n=1 Tax=Peptoniphilus ovalis TaxID=2841503 RepID=A0ABS6FHI9_9FIRM|nr:hypothetical protein [Peptoniphilus ovalis]MBU5669636.1 hypothetical protein [Peptoniphilus ovalis]